MVKKFYPKNSKIDYEINFYDSNNSRLTKLHYQKIDIFVVILNFAIYYVKVQRTIISESLALITTLRWVIFSKKLYELWSEKSKRC